MIRYIFISLGLLLISPITLSAIAEEQTVTPNFTAPEPVLADEAINTEENNVQPNAALPLETETPSLAGGTETTTEQNIDVSLESTIQDSPEIIASKYSNDDITKINEQIKKEQEKKEKDLKLARIKKAREERKKELARIQAQEKEKRRLEQMKRDRKKKLNSLLINQNLRNKKSHRKTNSIN